MIEKGHCEHGEFDLLEGCPQCITERLGEELKEKLKTNIVKVQYYSDDGRLSDRPYTYFTEDRLNVGDIVVVPVRDTTGKAKVTAVDVPATEIANFKDKVKTIPTGSMVQNIKVNLCDTCTLRNDYPICCAPDIVFGGGKGNDNIIHCSKYVNGLASPCTIPLGIVQPTESSKGRTTGFDPVNGGSIPPSVTNVGSSNGRILVSETSNEGSIPSPTVPPIAKELSIVEADTQVVGFYNQALSLRNIAKARVITCNNDLKPATDDLIIIRKVKKAMEEKRKEYLKPFQDHVKETNEAYKTLMEPIEEADKITAGKMLAFDAEQKRKIREAEAIEAEKLALARREEELTGEHTVDLTPVEKPEAVPEHVRGDMGTTGQRDNWKWEVTDINQVPREYLMINVGMLTPIVKASKGKLTIPGIRIYNEPIIAYRS